MNDFIGNHIKIIAEWGQWIMLIVILLCLYLLYLTGRKNRYFLPKGIRGYLSAFLLVLVILFSSLIFIRITMIKPGVMAILHQLETVKDQKAPPLNFQLVADSSSQTIEDYRGRVVVLNFWATWCAPCLKEMPDLARLQQDYRHRGLSVIALSDESRERLQKFAAARSLDLILAYTSSFDWVNLGPERPATFLIDREGVVRAYYTGPYDYAFFEKEIRKFLE